MFRTSTSCLVVCSVRGVWAAGAPLLVGRGQGPPPGCGLQPRQPRRGARARPRHAGPRHLAAGAGGDQPRLATPPLHPRLQRAGGGGGECRLCSRITITSPSGRSRRPCLHPQCKYHHRFGSKCFPLNRINILLHTHSKVIGSDLTKIQRFLF